MTSRKKVQLTVSYKKDKTVSGNEVIYATNAKYAKNKKTKVINKNSTSKITMSGLKAGKVYYAKIRSYGLVNGKKIFSDCSDTEYIRIMY